MVSDELPRFGRCPVANYIYFTKTSIMKQRNKLLAVAAAIALVAYPVLCLAGSIFKAPKLISYCDCSVTNECFKTTFYIADVTNCHSGCTNGTVSFTAHSVDPNGNLVGTAKASGLTDGTSGCINVPVKPCKQTNIWISWDLVCDGQVLRTTSLNYVHPAQSCNSTYAHTHNFIVNFCH
jgi:hypothetical protein